MSEPKQPPLKRHERNKASARARGLRIISAHVYQEDVEVAKAFLRALRAEGDARRLAEIARKHMADKWPAPTIDPSCAEADFGESRQVSAPWKLPTEVNERWTSDDPCTYGRMQDRPATGFRMGGKRKSNDDVD